MELNNFKDGVFYYDVPDSEIFKRFTDIPATMAVNDEGKVVSASKVESDKFLDPKAESAELLGFKKPEPGPRFVERLMGKSLTPVSTITTKPFTNYELDWLASPMKPAPEEKPLPTQIGGTTKPVQTLMTKPEAINSVIKPLKVSTSGTNTLLDPNTEQLIDMDLPILSKVPASIRKWGALAAIVVILLILIK